MWECSFNRGISKNYYEFQLVGEFGAFKSYPSPRADSIVIIGAGSHNPIFTTSNDVLNNKIIFISFNLSLADSC